MKHNRAAGDRRLAKMTASIDDWGSASPGDLPKVEDWEQEFPLSRTAAYSQKLGFNERGQLVEWAVVQLRLTNDRKRRVAVYDSCHGKGVHVHFFDCNEQEFAQKQLWPVDSSRDLEDGLDYAVRRVSSSWEENERRSDRGR